MCTHRATGYGWWVALVGLAIGVRAETIRLDFGWTPGMTANVEFVGSRSTTAGDLEVAQRLKGAYTLRVEDHDLGLLIRVDDMRLDLDYDPATDTPDPALLEAILHLASHPPGYVINGQGAYLGLTDLAAAQTRMTRLVEELAPNAAPDQRAAFRAALAPFADEKALRARVAEAWERDVGFWIGASLKVGEWYTLASTNSIAALGDASVPMTTRFRIAQRVPCVGDEQFGCVELELISAIDQGRIERVLESVSASRAAANQAAPNVRHLEQTARVSMVVDPASLRPYQIRSERKTTMGMEVGGSLRGGSQEETLVRMFTYADKGSRAAALRH